MSTTKKITISGPAGKSTITYPTEKHAENALWLMKRIQKSKRQKIHVPCDVETGKTEKLVDVKGWQVCE